jgi:hypothetical protein
MLLRAASPSTPSSASPCLSGASFSSEEHNVVDAPPRDKHKSKNERSQHQQPLPQKKHQQSSKASLCKKQQTNSTTIHGTTNSNSNSNNNSSKVIIDVACCDGPVRFHRVLNDNYGLTLDDILTGGPTKDKVSRHNTTHEPPLQNNQELAHVSHIHKQATSKSTLTYLQPEFKDEEIVNENTDQQPVATEIDEHTKGKAEQNTMMKQPVMDHISESGNAQEAETNLSEHQATDTGNSTKEDSSMPNLSDGNTSSSSASIASEKVSGSLETVYTCLYCNHTFKSHYCYQKHARRHINPVTIDLSRLAERLGSNKGAAVCKNLGSEKDKVNGGGGVRREVRLLDMNVQYYPCKTCGSKFPSYYFVHKHRKMCHANEDTESLVGSDESHSQSQTATSV